MDKFSVLKQSQKQILKVLRKQRTIAVILVALSEESCYKEELGGRLAMSKETISKGVTYLESTNLIKPESANAILRGGDEIKKMLGKENYINIVMKIQKIKTRLTKGYADDTLSRMRFYLVTEKATKPRLDNPECKSFLEFAKGSAEVYYRA